MIKKTLYFGNPAYLKTLNEQLIAEIQKEEKETRSIPIEDIGILIIDHPQITITQSLLGKLLANNTAFITCDQTHHPVGLLLSLDGNSLQSQKFKSQIEASAPLKKQLWQQTIIAKIRNQGALLKMRGIENKYLEKLTEDVKSGDQENLEAKAAAYYWKRIFPEVDAFRRDRFGFPPNNLLNYGYAILRALVARSLVASGLLATLGIHHRNQYNAYCLADDIMEPYRPFVDFIVSRLLRPGEFDYVLTPETKKSLLELPALDVTIEGKKSPLMNAVQRTTASLIKCFEGTSRKLLYPELR